MRQIWIPRSGAPEVLELREARDPTPGEGEVRIRVQAAGVNFADVMGRMGLYPDLPPLPVVVGYEVAGTIDAAGRGVYPDDCGSRGRRSWIRQNNGVSQRAHHGQCGRADGHS